MFSKGRDVNLDCHLGETEGTSAPTASSVRLAASSLSPTGRLSGSAIRGRSLQVASRDPCDYVTWLFQDGGSNESRALDDEANIRTIGRVNMMVATMTLTTTMMMRRYQCTWNKTPPAESTLDETCFQSTARVLRARFWVDSMVEAFTARQGTPPRSIRAGDVKVKDTRVTLSKAPRCISPRSPHLSKVEAPGAGFSLSGPSPLEVKLIRIRKILQRQFPLFLVSCFIFFLNHLFVCNVIISAWTTIQSWSNSPHDFASSPVATTRRPDRDRSQCYILYIYIYMYLYLSLSLSLYIYIYTYFSMSLSLSIYIYISIHTHTCYSIYYTLGRPWRPSPPRWRTPQCKQSKLVHRLSTEGAA